MKTRVKRPAHRTPMKPRRPEPHAPGEAGAGRVEGIVELADRGAGHLRQPSASYLPQPSDPVIPADVVRRFGLRDGTDVVATAGDQGGRRSVVDVLRAGGLAPAEYAALPQFQDLVSISPIERFDLASDPADTSLRVIDLIAPIGRGQRGLIVSPPRAGKTTIISQIAKAITRHHPETHLIVLLIDERPEEVTDFRRSVEAEVLASSSDSDSDAHIQLAWIAVERAKRIVEAGHHVFILLDSLTRLGRASNREQRGGGRTLSGGVSHGALQFPRQFFGAARACEEGGSLTIIATVLVDTGSRMDEVIFQEFKGTGNMELILDRELADRRIYPAVDVLRSGTRKEELLCSPEELAQRYVLRRALAGMQPLEAARRLISIIEKTPSNEALLGSLK